MATKLVKLLLASVIAMSAQTAWGQNVFREGMIWKTETGNLSRRHMELAYILDGDTLIGKTHALKLYCIKDGDTARRELRAIIRTERDKVYYLSGSKRKKWILLYDFSLKPGEGCHVGTIPPSGSMESTPKTTYVRCKRLIKSGESGEYTVMIMEEPFEGNDCIGRWIKGIGGIQGILVNNGFCLDGRNTTLRQVTCGDSTLYKTTKL